MLFFRVGVGKKDKIRHQCKVRILLWCKSSGLFHTVAACDSGPEQAGYAEVSTAFGTQGRGACKSECSASQMLNSLERKNVFQVCPPELVSVFFISKLTGPLELLQFDHRLSSPTYYIRLADYQLLLRKKPPGTLLPPTCTVEREFR